MIIRGESPLWMVPLEIELPPSVRNGLSELKPPHERDINLLPERHSKKIAFKRGKKKNTLMSNARADICVPCRCR